jgi:hypothetical protein
MNPHQRATKVLLLCLALIFLAVSQSRRVFGQTGQEWGKPENGLQLSLFPTSGLSASSTGFRFRLEIRNVGSYDLLLKLGALAANGQVQYPKAVSVLVTNPKGETVECTYPYPATAPGWGAPFIVPLPAEASFVLPVDLEKWTQNWKSCFTPDAYIPLDLRAGQYGLRVRYAVEIQKDRHFNLSNGGIVASGPPTWAEIQWAGQILRPAWIGTATSNQVRFDLPPHWAGK